MKILIKNARVVDKFTDDILDISIENERIVQVYSSRMVNEIIYDEVIDASGLIAMPGFIDTHAHFRDPGFTYKEDLESGSKAAINGGFTFVNLMANTSPVCDDIKIFEDIMNRAEGLDITGINQSMALTKNLLGKELIDIKNLPDKVKILSDDGKDLLSNHMMYQACKQACDYDKTIMVHAEDSEISSYDYRVAEDLITIRDVYLSKMTGAHIHMSHVSTKESIRAIREAKKMGANVTCEVTPHHISLYDIDYRVNPPIRTKADVRALIEAIKDGTVDSIGTDHAPHSEEEKKNGAPGMVGLENAFAVCYTYLVKSGEINLSKLSDIMSYGGKEVLSLEGVGLIREGFFADICLLDIDKEIIVDTSTFKSKSKNTPFENKKLYGSVELTIKRGKIKNDNR